MFFLPNLHTNFNLHRIRNTEVEAYSILPCFFVSFIFLPFILTVHLCLPVVSPRPSRPFYPSTSLHSSSLRPPVLPPTLRIDPILAQSDLFLLLSLDSLGSARVRSGSRRSSKDICHAKQTIEKQETSIQPRGRSRSFYLSPFFLASCRLFIYLLFFPKIKLRLFFFKNYQNSA